VGATIGLCLAPFTFGISLPAGVALGAAAGGCIAFASIATAIGPAFVVRAIACWIEDRLLYQRQGYDEAMAHMPQRLSTRRGNTLERLTYSPCHSGAFFDLWRAKCPTENAFLLLPSCCVKSLWVVFGGNAMVATDWIPFCEQVLAAIGPDASTAFLLFDYPGYGLCGGSPSPGSTLACSRGALLAALRRIGGVGEVEIHLFGHSLGAAAAAQLAADLGIDGACKGQLLMSAPFISIPAMVELLLSRPFASASAPKPLMPLQNVLCTALRVLLVGLVPHRWSNAAAVPAAVAAGWTIGIIHGTCDEIVPVEMGRELHDIATKVAAAESGGMLPTYVEDPKANCTCVELQIAKLFDRTASASMRGQ